MQLPTDLWIEIARCLDWRSHTRMLSVSAAFASLSLSRRAWDKAVPEWSGPISQFPAELMWKPITHALVVNHYCGSFPQHLTHLNMWHVHDGQVDLTRHLELQTLYLNGCRNCQFVLPPCVHTLKTFDCENLRYHNTKDLHTVRFDGYSFLGFRAPHLRYLEMDEVHWPLHLITTLFPKLEELAIDFGEHEYDQITEIERLSLHTLRVPHLWPTRQHCYLFARMKLKHLTCKHSLSRSWPGLQTLTIHAAYLQPSDINNFPLKLRVLRLVNPFLGCYIPQQSDHDFQIDIVNA